MARPRKSAHLDPDRYADALARWMGEHSFTQREAAERLGVTQADISRWVNRRGLPSPTVAARVLPLVGVAPEDVAPLPAGSAPSVLAAADVVLVPRDGTAGAGAIGIGHDGDEVHDADAYPASELKRLTGLDPFAFRQACVIGDSNLPTLLPGQYVLYDPRDTISDHGLYVLDLDGERVVKFVQRLAGGAFSLIPENKRYRVETFTPVDDASEANTYRSDLSGRTARLTVVGKVVWYPTLA